ncbi:MAG: hypothetical protein JRI68_08005 [Deltaproteobacteria bacterium]|nr:hypothetical protein [Deltaproteobacteria bacterium]
MARSSRSGGRCLAAATVLLLAVLGCSGSPGAPQQDPGRRANPATPLAEPSTAPEGLPPAPLSVAPPALPVPEPGVDSQATDGARFLAGMAGGPDAPFDHLRQLPFWQEHARHLNAQWEGFVERRLKPVRRFGQAELTAAERASPRVLYPFGGPDLVFADALFPHSPDLVLAGLEPLGALPDLGRRDAPRLVTALRQLRASLVPALGLGYFITEQMEEQRAEARFPGVLPLLFVFLARTGHEISSVQRVAVDPDGGIGPAVGPGDGLVPGVVIRCRRPGEPLRLVAYFQVDLRDAALGRDDRFARLVRRRGVAVTLLKCASYLLHEARFSTLRHLVLEGSSTVIQDPSGLPFRAFDPTHWSLSLYGNFQQPIPRFAHRPQPDLRRSFATTGTVGTLDFRTGYQSSLTRSSLLVARRRSEW